VWREFAPQPTPARLQTPHETTDCLESAWIQFKSSALLLGLEEAHEHSEGLGLFAELSHNGARATHDLGGLAGLVDLAEASVLAELLASVHHEEVHAALFAERLHQLGVLRVVAVRRQAAQLGSLLVEGLGAPEIKFKAMGGVRHMVGVLKECTTTESSQ